MSWERCHYFTETCTFIYNISENFIVKFQKCHLGKENRPKKLKTHEKLKVLNKEKSGFIPILNHLVLETWKCFILSHSYLKKRKCIHFWRKKNLGVFFNGQIAQKWHIFAFWSIFTPKKLPQKFFWPKINKFSFLVLWLA